MVITSQPFIRFTSFNFWRVGLDSRHLGNDLVMFQCFPGLFKNLLYSKLAPYLLSLTVCHHDFNSLTS